jgi:iron complex outermembrane receptor protein
MWSARRGRRNSSRAAFTRRPAHSTSAIPISRSKAPNRSKSACAGRWGHSVSRRRLSYTRFDGFIFRNLTGAVCENAIASCAIDGEGDLRQANYAQRNATFRGGEFQSQLDLAPLLGGVFGVENQFDVVRATFVGGGNAPRIPPARLGGGLFWRDSNWLMRVHLLHAFAQRNIDPTNETPTKGYNLLRAEISYRMLFDPGDPRGRAMTIGLVGDNLLNDDIRNSVSFR